MSKSFGSRTPSGLHRYVQHLRGLFHFPVAHRHPSIVRLPENRHAHRPGHRLLEQLQPFRTKRDRFIGDPGYVASWPCEALDQTDADGLADKSHHDRDRRGCLLGGVGRWPSYRYDRVNFEPNEFASQPGEPIPFGVGPPAQVDDILPLDVAELLEGLA